MSELGLFPLGIVLLPSEQIPLHIFEDRYQELIGECLEEEREFGLIYADDDGLREVGTLAAVTEVLDRFDDGRLNVVVEGRERFRLLELTDGRSFQTGLVEPIEDENDVADPEDSEHALELFHRLVELTGAEVEEPRLSAEQLSFELAGRFEFAPGAQAEAACSSRPSASACTCSPSCSPARRPRSSASARSPTAPMGTAR